MNALKRFNYKSICTTNSYLRGVVFHSNKSEQPKYSPRLEEFKKRLQEEEFPVTDKPANRQITPLRKLDQKNVENNLIKQVEFEPFPNNTNPVTGEINGPRGPEPTRYGDWENKGRCTDF